MLEETLDSSVIVRFNNRAIERSMIKGVFDMVRKNIRFEGNVQGVGFRYRAYHAAVALGLTGWVSNEWDGSVLMEVQGQEKSIDKMIVMIQQGTYITVEKMTVKNISVDSEERSFRVKGY